MADGGQDFNLGHVVGSAGEKGDDGSTVWNTSTAPTYANSKYTFTISNLSGKTGLQIAVNDIIFYSTYYYIVSAVNSTTADCTTRINIKGADASVTIVDNLTSTSSTSVLSAKQGKVLNDNKLDIAQTSYKGKNVVVDSSSGNITFENKPTIPSASSTTPSADISGGSIGSGTTWAKADHQHPLSTAYATSGHTHGNLQSDGSVGTSSNASKNVVTDSNGKITTEAKPTIPTKISDLTNDSDFIEKSSTSGLIKNDGSVDTNAYITSTSLPTKTSDLQNDGADGTNAYVANNDSRLSDSRTPTSHTHGQITNDGKITSTAVTVASGDNILITDTSDSSKVKRVANILAGHVKDSTAHANIGSSANDSQATINTDINTALGNKQATLVSGTNIKTVNNESLLGSGNITIEGGSNVDVVTSWEATLSDTKVPSEKLTKNSLDAKADASSLATVATTGDYDDLTDKPTIPSASTTTPSADTSSGSYGSGTNYARSNHTHPKSSLYAEATHSHTKSQITDFPSIPSKTSDLTNDGADGTNVFVANNDSRLSDSRTPTSHTHGNLSNDGKLGTTSGKPVITTTGGAITTGSFGSTSGTFAEGNHTHSAYVNPTKVTSWSSTPSDSNVASEKLIKDSLDAKQATLVSGTNLKTINNNSLLGSGNITIQGGSGGGGSYINNYYWDSTSKEIVLEYTNTVDPEIVVTSWSSTPSNDNVASEKLVKDSLDDINDLIGDAITYINQ